MHLSFALSITHFFTSAGADAGFAALIGLAILVLLYFAHARETSTLRDQLEAATRRIEQLEHRAGGGAAPSIGAKQPLAADASSTAPVAAPPTAATGSSPAPAGAPAQPAAAPSPPTAPPVAPRPLSAPPVAARPLSAPPVVAPAGVGAPPLSDATRVVPLAEPAGGPEDPEPVPGEHAALAGDGLGATSSPMAGTTPSPVTAAGGNGFAGASATDGARGGSRSLLEHGLPGQGKIPRWVVAVLGVVLVAVIAVVLVLVLHPGSSQHNTAKVVHHHHAVAIAAAPSGVTPSLVTVAVVNATNINELAHHVSTHLTALHFQPGTLATATNPSHTKTTVVGYLPGHRNDALAVAHALKLPATAVRPVTQSSEGLVCPSPSDCAADVIVVAGANLAPKR
ncbi:MAG TPA: LytR C-terminal domain-containing protein [Solirubrobacteraceae bacterium]